ncbi:triphosphoribosyl-dephospho-CoA synthase [Methylophaga sp.]|uniref:triphosphoribosyl-dephospho-CoA synthase n=1 Tax=Methylophaga sp. TaxID=2024840 RepID=UPI0027160C96|nr:triphosphoribosyl-dephospho-CoA synthase [Methylophaga sp.]MDO8827948.1 triphosphoribosyl-dephospho-CoA synthase [Methylophaga sp.]
MLVEQQINDCVRWACEQEVNAPKPGNVNVWSDGHNMAVQDFLLSAKAIAPVMAQPNLSVGERILQAVEATRQVVNCNTNLGIVLLFAPLCDAVQRCSTFDALSLELEQTLSSLTLEDAHLCYQAIRLAEAGGLGEQTEQDINQQPSVTLREAMLLAQHRDTIALQYVNNYQQVWDIGYKQLTEALKCGEKVEWATTIAYLYLLARVPDTLIIRKQSRHIAQTVAQKAQLFILKMNKNRPLSKSTAELTVWDHELKSRAINPGTSADMTAATLLLFAFEQAFDSNRISVARCL